MDKSYLNTVLVPAIEAEKSIKAYQLNVTSNHTIKSGFINNDFGGIYRPVINSKVERVEFRATLADGRSSIGSAQLSVSPGELIRQILTSAHNAKEPIVFAPKHDKLEEVRLVDKEILAIVEDKPEVVSKLTKDLQTQQLGYNHVLVEGGVKLTVSHRHLVSSNGVCMDEASTRQSMYAYYEDRIGIGLAKRKLFGVGKLDEHSVAMSRYMKDLNAKPAKLSNGRYPILLESGEGWRLLDKFILGNLSGMMVDAGQSHFKKEDFQNKLAISHPNFNLSYNQRKPMSTESFNFSSQGVLSQEFSLIKDGKLTEPICDLKTAKKLGYEAKTLSSLYNEDVEKAKFDEFVSTNPTFILVFGLMGVHTSKTSLGDYSLPAPDSLLIRGGKVIGPINCVLSGNFFDILKQSSTGFVDASHAFDGPALTFETQVTVK